MIINRIWCMPSKWTFDMPPVKELFKRYAVGEKWCDPFAGKNIVTAYHNNLAVSGIDASEYVNSLSIIPVGYLFDPPYSMEQCKRSYDSAGISHWQTKFGNNKNGGFANVKDNIAKKISENGIVISFGWNSNGMGKGRGFDIEEILLLAHGGNRHDTIITVEKRK